MAAEPYELDALRVAGSAAAWSSPRPSPPTASNIRACLANINVQSRRRAITPDRLLGRPAGLLDRCRQLSIDVEQWLPSCIVDRISDPTVFERWQPLTLAAAADLFEGLGAYWWVAGGHAIDLFLGAAEREHVDIDIQVLRDELPTVRAFLKGLEFWAADPPGHLSRWHPHQAELPAHVHDIWCRLGADVPWCLQLMVAEANDGVWHYRRNPAVTLTLDRLGHRSPEGLPYVAPEVQLLFKWDSERPKDRQDIDRALPRLGPEARQWLASAVASGRSATP